MKQLILLSLLLFCCKSPVDNEPVEVSFEVLTTNKHIEDAEFKIFKNSQLADYGKLPLPMTAYTGDVLTAQFEARVSNFALNHPQCDCEQIEYAYYKCTESRVVDGEDWDVGK